MKRSIVAIVQVQPETAIEGAHRALRLAGADRTRAWTEPTRIAVRTAHSSAGVGGSTTPWQFTAARSWLAHRSHAVTGPVIELQSGKSGGVALTGEIESLVRSAGLTSQPLGQASKNEPEIALPTLRAFRPNGVMVVPELSQSTIFCLPSLQRSAAVTLRGATEAACALVGTPLETFDPNAELRADLLELCRHTVADTWCLVDGTVFGSDGTWGRPTIENLLIAGNDPLAVDAVACRLVLGIDPERIPWIRRCAERALGVIGRSEIELVGDVDANAKLGMDAPPRTRRMRSGGIAAAMHSVDPRQLLQPWRMRRWARSFAPTPWGLLADAYRRGDEPKPEDRL